MKSPTNKGYFFPFIFLFSVFFSASNAANEAIIIFAASSLSQPLNEIAQTYEEQVKQKLSISYASSSSLARQLNHGAPADIFISANPRWMDYVEQQELTEGKATAWLTNQLALISSKPMPALKGDTAQNLQHILNDQHLAISNPNHVPLGIYTKEALQSLKLWNEIEKNAVLTNNARATLALVERKEVPFGIVYYTDTLFSPSVNLLHLFAKDSHSPIIYSKVLIHPANQATKAFYNYLNTDQAKKILLKYGFTLIKE